MSLIDQDPLVGYHVRQSEWERTVETMRLVKEARGTRRVPLRWHTPGLLVRLIAALAVPRRIMTTRPAIVAMARPRRGERDRADC